MSKSPKIKIEDITADDETVIKNDAETVDETVIKNDAETVIKNDEVLANETNDEIVCISSDIKEKTVVNEFKK